MHIPPHIHALLNRLHTTSITQESTFTFNLVDIDPTTSQFHEMMRDKLLALDKDKCQFVYQLCRAINAKSVVEAGTSHGVSTIYLALAVAENVAATGGKGMVIGTENEHEKAEKAREHWRECGEMVTSVVDLREGDLRETLKENVQDVDLLLLDIWTPLALPALKLVQPKMRYGAVVVVDNTIQYEDRYKELLEYLRDRNSGFSNLTLPFTNGLEMSVYLP